MAAQNRDVTVGEGILPADHKASLPSNASLVFKEMVGADSPTSYHIQNSTYKLDSPHKDDSNASTSHILHHNIIDEVVITSTLDKEVQSASEVPHPALVLHSWVLVRFLRGCFFDLFLPCLILAVLFLLQLLLASLVGQFSGAYVVDLLCILELLGGLFGYLL
ncbi:hypothetical protein LguiB_005655 [Lonicera macranthoides]